jgi:hypothetical protein
MRRRPPGWRGSSMKEGAALALADGGLARRITDDALLVLTGVVLILLAREISIVVPAIMGRPGALGVDLHLYQGATRSWLAGDGFYHARQLAGPYTITGANVAGGGDILYPPVILWLLVPFTILPEVLWYMIPAVAIAWAIVRLRPARWAWPIIALGFALPFNIDVWAPVIWVTAAFALGCVVAGPAVLVLLKPSLFPFALMGANRRRWWIALALFALASLPFGFLWLDWARAILNSDGSLAYSAREIQMLAIPLVAWFARRGTVSHVGDMPCETLASRPTTREPE